MAMQDSHRLFLQSFMSHGIMSGKEVKDIHKDACRKYGQPDDGGSLAAFVNTINGQIRPVHLEIKKGVNEETGQHVYGLVNIVDSDITKLSTEYSVAELEFFKKLVETIVESEDGAVRSIDAINLTDSLNVKLSRQDAEKLLIRLEQGKWLAVNDDGGIGLSTRSILELDQYIQDQFPDNAVKCNMCSRLVLKGQACSQCDVKLHLHCAKRYFDKQPNHKCPSCGAQWPFTPVATQPESDLPASQIPETQESPDTSRREGGRRSKRKSNK